MDYFLTLLHNMSTPVMVFCLIGLAVCGVMGFYAADKIEETTFPSREHENARWLGWTTTNCALIFAIVGAIFWAIPEPDYTKEKVTVYKYRVVEKPVYKTKIVYKDRIITPAAGFNRVYNNCIQKFSTPYNVEETSSCRTTAYVALGKKVLVKKVVVGTKTDKYIDLFKVCLSEAVMNDDRDEISYCRGVAREAVLIEQVRLAK